MQFFVEQTLLYTIPLMIVALAGVFSERSGIINIALEGIMVFGVFIGVLSVRLLVKNNFTIEKSIWVLIGAMIITAIAGGLFSLLLAFASINLKADQTIGGTALNMLAPAIVLFISNIFFQQSTLNINFTQYSIKEMFPPYVCDIIAVVIYIILSVILYTTKFGLRLRACGENPQAADSLGINVYKMRYIGTTISGCLAAFGGFFYSVTACGCTSTGDVAGLGFLALAVMIFGNWKPINICFAALLFGSMKCLAAGYSYIDFNGDGVYALANLGISSYVYNILPYFITLIVLAFTSKNSRAPKAEGQPYDKGKR